MNLIKFQGIPFWWFKSKENSVQKHSESCKKALWAGAQLWDKSNRFVPHRETELLSHRICRLELGGSCYSTYALTVPQVPAHHANTDTTRALLWCLGTVKRLKKHLAVKELNFWSRFFFFLMKNKIGKGMQLQELLLYILWDKKKMHKAQSKIKKSPTNCHIPKTWFP